MMILTVLQLLGRAALRELPGLFFISLEVSPPEISRQKSLLRDLCEPPRAIAKITGPNFRTSLAQKTQTSLLIKLRGQNSLNCLTSPMILTRQLVSSISESQSRSLTEIPSRIPLSPEWARSYEPKTRW